MQRFFIQLLWIFNIVAAVALVVAYISPFIDPSIISFPAFFGLAFPLLLFLNLAFAIIWLFINWKYSLLSLILIVAGYSEVKAHVQLFPEKKSENVKGIKVLTYNVRNYGFKGRKNIKSTVEGIKKEVLVKESPDIICLQEGSGKNKLKLNGYKIFGKTENFIFLKSKAFKVIKKGDLIDGSDNKFGLFADVIFNDDTIRVFNVQLLSYSVSGDIEEYETQPEKVNPKKKIITITKKLKKGFTYRVNETYKLRKALEKSPYPVILCGDFNDPPASYTYRELITTGLKDSFTESGKGYGNTYNGYLPNMRIDYILASENLDFYNYKVIKTDFSDHFPVTALVEIPSKK